MSLFYNRRKSIRANDKSLVYHFSIGTPLPLFILALPVLNIGQLMRTDWEVFNLLKNQDLSFSLYNFITVILATVVCFLVVSLVAVSLVFNAVGVKDIVLELFNKIIGA